MTPATRLMLHVLRRTSQAAKDCSPESEGWVPIADVVQTWAEGAPGQLPSFSVAALERTGHIEFHPADGSMCRPRTGL